MSNAPASVLPAPPVAAAPNRVLAVRRLGLVPYVPTWALQEELLAATVALKTRNRQAEAVGEPPESTPNHLLLCQHPPTYTLGKSGKPEHLLLDDAGLAQYGATYHGINRGGDITYHGPGQLVGYPILDLDNFRPDIHWYLRTLEEAVVRTLASYGIDTEGRPLGLEIDVDGRSLAGYGLRAGRIAGLTGVWLGWEEGTANPRKICALGVKCSRWVTMHGFALNVTTDLSYFGHIVPCGIADKAVTSLAQELGRPVAVEEVQERLLPHLAALLGATPT